MIATLLLLFTLLAATLSISRWILLDGYARHLLSGFLYVTNFTPDVLSR